MNLIKSTGTFSFFTIISRLLGYLRDILVAIFLGTSFLADVFFVAFRIPNTFRRLFSEGTFNAAFVPSYSSELNKGKEKSNKFALEVFNFLFLILLILVLLVQIFMPIFVSLIAPGFIDDNEKMKLAINLTRITFPFLILVSLASFFSSILMGLFFNYLMTFLNDQLSFENSLKSIYLILSVVLGLSFYLLISYLIKAFKLEDIKLKY